MIALEILEIKDFMNKLLIDSVFDNFLLVSLEIRGFVDINIDGRINKDWYDEPKAGYITWKEIKEKVRYLIKEDRPPLLFKLVFRLSESNTRLILEKIRNATYIDDGLFFTLKFEKNIANIVTGISTNNFLINRELSTVWDSDFIKFIKYYKIGIREII